MKTGYREAYIGSGHMYHETDKTLPLRFITSNDYLCLFPNAREVRPIKLLALYPSTAQVWIYGSYQDEPGSIVDINHLYFTWDEANAALAALPPREC